jgi:hypothetical protein
MMDFYYKNSQGVIINFNEEPFLGLKNNNLFDYSWTYITQGQAVQKIVKFEKVMVEKSFPVVISGDTNEKYLANLDHFLQLIDVDIDRLQMGELHVGKYYLECYIFASGKNGHYLDTNKSKLTLSIVCERGNWQSSELFDYSHGGEHEQDITVSGIDYPYDYMYDFNEGFDKNMIVNESYMGTDFELTFFGPTLLPEVIIGGNVYRINKELYKDEKIVVNSKTKTVTLYKADGSAENAFAYRDRDNYIFQKIQAGGNMVHWEHDLVWTIMLYYERSEPKWSDIVWT